MNTEEIFQTNQDELTRLEAEKKRKNKNQQNELRQWRELVELSRPALLIQASAKAEAWMRKNLIRPSELLRIQALPNGYVLHVKLLDGRDEQREWTLRFLFHPDGASQADFIVRWEVERRGRDELAEYLAFED